MKETRILMGMPVTVEIVDDNAKTQESIEKAFAYFKYVDETFSTFKETSEISRINRKELTQDDWSQNMKTVFSLAEKTKQETDGYFDIIANDGSYDPSGIVKGWAILQVSHLLSAQGFENFYVEAGGDIQVSGKKSGTEPWNIGIRNPFKTSETVKTVALPHNEGIATSGSYERGSHIYNPKDRSVKLAEIVSITVIAKDILEADRFATAAFAMQRNGIYFLEKIGLAGYMIAADGQATMTTNFARYVQSA